MANANDDTVLASPPASENEHPAEGAASGLTDASANAKASTSERRQHFWTLWEAELPALHRVACSFTRRHPEDAADVLSQATIRCCEAFERHAYTISDFGPWSRRVVKHAAIDLLRERARSQRADALELQSGAFWETRVSDETVHRQCSAREEVGRSIVRIAALPEHLLAVAAPCLVHGVSYEETAANLGLHIENVRKRVQHARELLTLSTLEAAPDSECLATSIRMILGVEARLLDEEGQLRPWLVRRGADDNMRYHLSFGRISTKRYHQRLAALLRYTAEHPRGWKKRWQLAELLFAHGAWEEAASHYLTLLRAGMLEQRCARRGATRLLEMAALSHRPSWAEAARKYTPGADDDPALSDLMQAYASLASGDCRAALVCASSKRERDGEDLELMLERARLYELAGERELAWDACGRAERAHPQNLELRTRGLHLALVLGKRGSVIEKQTASLLEEDPSNPIARCAAIHLHPDARASAREVAALARHYPGWALPRMGLAKQVLAPRCSGPRDAPQEARGRGTSPANLCQSA